MQQESQRRVRAVSRLLFKLPRQTNDSLYPKSGCAGQKSMVKRTPTVITVGNADTVNALADSKSIKKDGAWRYPGGVIQRHESVEINGRKYYDHKDPGEARRKQESNFFITLNTNRSCEGGGAKAEDGKQAMKETLDELSRDDVICSYLKFGPKHAEYKADRYEDVIAKIEWSAAVELGENLHRLHCHIWLSIYHYSQVQINMNKMQRIFKDIYNAKVAGSPYASSLKCGAGKSGGLPYIQVKLLPESNWAEVMKQYIHKAMTAT